MSQHIFKKYLNWLTCVQIGINLNRASKCPMVEAGIEMGDCIIQFNSTPIEDVSGFIRLFRVEQRNGGTPNVS